MYSTIVLLAHSSPQRWYHLISKHYLPLINNYEWTFIMSLDLRKGDVVVLRENSLFWNDYYEPGNVAETSERVVYCGIPMKISKVYVLGENTNILLHSANQRDILVPVSTIAHKIGNVHDWFGICGSCQSLCKGGTQCWKCNILVEPDCITWSNMKIFPRCLQRGGTDPVMYVSFNDYSDGHPDSFESRDIQDATDYEYLDWLQSRSWRPQSTYYWMPEIYKVLHAIGMKHMTPTVMHMIETGFWSNQHTFRQSQFMNFALNHDFNALESIEDDDITVAYSYSSDDDVQMLQRTEDYSPQLRYNYFDHGPDSIGDWYKEIGWILAAIGVRGLKTEMLNILHYFDQGITSF
jgi:hypothetical protein